jgi:hypothetical protein
MRRRDSLLLLVLGLLVAVAPFAWYAIVWPDSTFPTNDGNLYPASTAWKAAAAIFAVPPFVMLAFFRRADLLSRIAAVVALAATAGIVVLVQYATLDPNDTSSTAAIGFIFEVFWGCVAVGVVASADRIVRNVARRGT